MPHAFADLLDIGLSPLDSLRAMTSRGADAIGAAGKGRLVAGSDADLIALDGDPLTDPSAIHRLRAVWHGGRSVA